MQHTERNSNIELLRIIIMYMILLLHSNFMTFDVPADYSPVSFIRCFVEALTLPPVNIFVLITGYFGTKVTISKIGGLLYQVLFCLVPVSLVLSYYLSKPLSIESFNIFHYWFINAYVALLIVTPILNAAVAKFSKLQFRYFLALYYVFIVLCGSFLQVSGVAIERGYSVLWFIFLYLIARYVRIYPCQISKSKLVLIILLSCLCKTTLIFFTHKFINYVDPFILLQSVCTLLLFTKFDIKKKWINSIATSTTMVYLIHLHPIYWTVFKTHLRKIFDLSSNTLLFIVLLLTYCLAVYVLAIFYDRIRQWTWAPIGKRLKKIDFSLE